MKKFNFNEFIWFLTLIAIEAILTYLFKSREIYNYLEEGILSLRIVQGIFLIFIAVQIPKVFTFNSRQDESLKALPIILSIIAIFLFVSKKLLLG